MEKSTRQKCCLSSLIDAWNDLILLKSRRTLFKVRAGNVGHRVVCKNVSSSAGRKTLLTYFSNINFNQVY